MRREILLAVPCLLLALLVQTAIVSRIRLLDGTADLVLVLVAAWALQERVRSGWVWGAAAGLLVGAVTGLGWLPYLGGYLGAVALARLLVHRVWQAPLLAMFAVTLLASLAILAGSHLLLVLSGVELSFGTTFTRIILPSTLLNLLVGIPVHSLMRDLARGLYRDWTTE